MRASQDVLRLDSLDLPCRHKKVVAQPSSPQHENAARFSCAPKLWIKPGSVANQNCTPRVKLSYTVITSHYSQELRFKSLRRPIAVQPYKIFNYYFFFWSFLTHFRNTAGSVSWTLERCKCQPVHGERFKNSDSLF